MEQSQLTKRGILSGVRTPFYENTEEDEEKKEAVE